MRLGVIQVGSNTLHHFVHDAPSGLQPLTAPTHLVLRKGTTSRRGDEMS
ncbi:MAG: hypothetical protein ABIQ61_09320 [Ornithinibacter sp.]